MVGITLAERGNAVPLPHNLQKLLDTTLQQPKLESREYCASSFQGDLKTLLNDQACCHHCMYCTQYRHYEDFDLGVHEVIACRKTLMKLSA